MEERLKKIEQMIGNTYKYEGKRVKILNATINGNKATLITDGDPIELTMDEMLDEDLSEFKFIKEDIILKNPQVEDLALKNADLYDMMSDTLIRTIKRIENDAEYIPQASEINNTARSLIDLEKTRIATLALLKR